MIFETRNTSVLSSRVQIVCYIYAQLYESEERFCRPMDRLFVVLDWLLHQTSLFLYFFWFSSRQGT